MYVADYNNHRIRKITMLPGIITTIAGTGATSNDIGDGGQAMSAALKLPSGVAVDSSGRVRLNYIHFINWFSFFVVFLFIIMMYYSFPL